MEEDAANVAWTLTSVSLAVPIILEEEYIPPASINPPIASVMLNQRHSFQTKA